jgi:cytochrome c oxidase subunit 1
MVRRLPDYPASAGWGTLNLLSTIGAYTIAVAMLVFAAAVLKTALQPRTAEPDPWGTGMSLEWATASPPPPENFPLPLPPVRSYAPLYDARHVEVAA